MSDAFVDGNLGAADSLAVGTHLRGCVRCRSLVEDKRHWKRRLKRSVQSLPVPVSLVLGIQGAIRCATAN